MLAAMPRDGELFRTNDAYPAAKQPGGPGTVVTDPIQPQGAFVSRYMLGCGHSITRYDVKQEVAQEGEPLAGQLVKRLCCPACGYVQRTMLASEYVDQQRTPIAF